MGACKSKHNTSGSDIDPMISSPQSSTVPKPITPLRQKVIDNKIRYEQQQHRRRIREDQCYDDYLRVYIAYLESELLIKSEKGVTSLREYPIIVSSIPESRGLGKRVPDQFYIKLRDHFVEQGFEVKMKTISKLITITCPDIVS